MVAVVSIVGVVGVVSVVSLVGVAAIVTVVYVVAVAALVGASSGVRNCKDSFLPSSQFLKHSYRLVSLSSAAAPQHEGI